MKKILLIVIFSISIIESSYGAASSSDGGSSNYDKGASSGFMQISLVNSRRRGALYRFTQSRFVLISLAPPRAVLRVRP